MQYYLHHFLNNCISHLFELTGMGGIDLMDRLLGSYRPTITSKKWWWPLFLNALNVSVVAAWRIYCNIHSQSMTHIEFRRSVTLCLLKSSRKRPTVGGGAHANLPDDVRYDGIGHKREAVAQGRCVQCKKNCRSQCDKCKVRLHVKDCFDVYHHQ